MRALYLNDNAVIPHVGCKAVTDGHDRLFARLGIEVVHRFYKNDLWFAKAAGAHPERVDAIEAAFGPLIASVDAVIVNGEGTFHHGRGEDLLAFLAAAQRRGRATFVINALIQEMAPYAETFGACDAVVTRDPVSFEQALALGARAHLLPDAFVLAGFADGGARAPADLVVTDYHGAAAGGPGAIIDRLLHERDGQVTYFPLQSPLVSSRWRSTVDFLRGASCIVSARHHGCYAAALAGRPFVIMASNSHKMEAFRAMTGDFIPYVESWESVDAAIEQARDHAADFARLPEKLASYGYEEQAAAIFGGRAMAARPETPEAVDGLAYATTLLEARHRRDPRFLPLRQEIAAVAAGEGSYAAHKPFWDKLLKLARKRAFLVDELQGAASVIRDDKLLEKMAQAASLAQPDAGYYGATLGARTRSPSKPNRLSHLRSAVLAGVPAEVDQLIASFEPAQPRDVAALVGALVPALHAIDAHKELVALEHFWQPTALRERDVLKLAGAHYALGRYASARRWLETVQTDDRLRAAAQARIAHLQLRAGEFEGWSSMEATLREDYFVRIREQVGLPAWRKGMPGVQRLLVWFHDRGGLGSEIMWARALRAFRSVFDGEITLVVDPRLRSLFAASHPGCSVLGRDAAFPEAAADCQAFLFGMEMAPYVIAREEDFGAIAGERLLLPAPAASVRDGPREPRRDVALSWKTTNAGSSAYRNVPLDALAAVLARHPFHYHALQHGDIAADVAVLRATLGERLHVGTLNPQGTMEDIGRSLSGMDAVVTIDNTTLHVAGALGLETLALFSIPSYWQWPAAGEGSRWYDTVRLLRQDAPGHWDKPLALLDVHLGRIAAAASRS